MNGTAGITQSGYAWKTHPNGGIRYIGKPNGLPGREGVDWGWTDKVSEAMELSPYW